MGTRVAEQSEASARPLAGLTKDDVAEFGKEAADLETLRDARLPLAIGTVLRLRPPVSELERAIAETQGGRADDAVQLRPWYRSASVAARVQWPALAPAEDRAELARQLHLLLKESETTSWKEAGLIARRAIRLRAIRVDRRAVRGVARSVGVRDGDPEVISVWLEGKAAFRIDRKTMRVVRRGEGPLPERTLESVADLADRAQLAIGEPVEIEWILASGRPAIGAVRRAEVEFSFPDEPMRRVELLWADEGPMSPISTDALDRALGETGDGPDSPRVARVFARAYRRIRTWGRVEDSEMPFPIAAAKAGQATREVGRYLVRSRSHVRSLPDRFAQFEALTLCELEDRDLIHALRERQLPVVECYRYLDRARKCTGQTIRALEAVVGPLPRECVLGLAALARTRQRRRIDEHLARVAKDASRLEPDRRTAHLAALRPELPSVRPLGLDIRPLPFCDPQKEFDVGVVRASEERSRRAEEGQRAAVRRLLATARSRPRSTARLALARSMTYLLERLAISKGKVAESLAEANLRFRAAVLTAGGRLIDRGVLDSADDALYLHLSEIADALMGEPGAYGARVRLRREEDARWRNMQPPLRIQGRASFGA